MAATTTSSLRTDLSAVAELATQLARTVKGKGFSEVEDSPDWQVKSLPADMAARPIAELGGERHIIVRGPRPTPVNTGHRHPRRPAYDRRDTASARGRAGGRR
jgi:transketolase